MLFGSSRWSLTDQLNLFCQSEADALGIFDPLLANESIKKISHQQLLSKIVSLSPAAKLAVFRLLGVSTEGDGDLTCK
jgi:hypothetical protein